MERSRDVATLVVMIPRLEPVMCERGNLEGNEGVATTCPGSSRHTRCHLRRLIPVLVSLKWKSISWRSKSFICQVDLVLKVIQSTKALALDYDIRRRAQDIHFGVQNCKASCQ